MWYGLFAAGCVKLFQIQGLFYIHVNEFWCEVMRFQTSIMLLNTLHECFNENCSYWINFIKRTREILCLIYSNFINWYKMEGKILIQFEILFLCNRYIFEINCIISRCQKCQFSYEAGCVWKSDTLVCNCKKGIP